MPYGGLKGDYQSVTVLAPTAAGFPFLAKVVDNTLVKKPEGATFSLTDDDLPYIVVHLAHQSRRMRWEIFDAATGQPFHRALEIAYLPRNSTTTGATSFFALPWDGITAHGRRFGPVPDGTYVLVMSVQKALGDDDNPAHWESWTSPPITIDRP